MYVRMAGGGRGNETFFKESLAFWRKAPVKPSDEVFGQQRAAGTIPKRV